MSQHHLNSYCIVRFVHNVGRDIVLRGLTYEEALEHCNDPETSSTTCSRETSKRLDLVGFDWFDGFERELI
jgi:hypothetical protein